MSKASKAARFITAFCQVEWPDGGVKMASTIAERDAGTFAGYVGGGSHKYIEADEITAHLGEPEGAGVYGYERFDDGSCILLMCKGPLAVLDEKGARWL